MIYLAILSLLALAGLAAWFEHGRADAIEDRDRALDDLHAMTSERDRLRTENAALLERFRALTADVVQTKAAYARAVAHIERTSAAPRSRKL